jgi:nitric oxide reductase NorQ protein|tara:strand:+ start:10309 stop:11526 length:1218 start_codon:yes stop_codon:yes gene_type:complete
MSNENQVGYVSTEVYKVEQFGNTFKLIDTMGVKVGTLGATTGVRKSAFNKGMAVQAYINKNGKKSYRKVDMNVYNSLVIPMNTQDGGVQFEDKGDHTAIKDFIHKGSVQLKPTELVMEDLKWKYLIRSAVRAKNIMMTGPSGCGKTMASKALVTALDRPDFYFNLGATQDPRATLIGNTHFDKQKGTFFSESAFVTALKTPNAVILLDELSRAHPDAWNILMTVLDQGQRYLRLDEAEGSPIVNVAEGVTFIATANIGNEYTSTRVMDRAILDRFVTIEMDVLDDVKEFGLLKFMFPEVNENDLKAIAEISHHTRTQSMSENGKLTSMVSTRASVEMAGLIYDGFDLEESAEISIYPFFSQDGGVDSERTYIKQLVQKYQKDENGEPLFKEVDGTESNEDDIPQF